VERVGYLVPAADFDATVHSVFARACNFDCGGSLLTLVARNLADGPTTLRVGTAAPTDLRALFRPGERLRCRDGIAAAPGVTMRLTGAAIWRPGSSRALASTTHLATNLRVATTALASRRRTHSSVIDREGSTVLDELGGACRALDAGTAAQRVERLIGWGEGLTPAGDDVLVGWRAALDALVDGHPGRADFLCKFSAAILAGASRTTPLAAHCLRLAARGHYNADVIGLRNALLGESDAAALHAVLTDALNIGATSGADMVTGMLAGIEAWLDVDAPRERGHAGGEAELECASG
jgi:hypothetical protein